MNELLINTIANCTLRSVHNPEVAGETSVRIRSIPASDNQTAQEAVLIQTVLTAYLATEYIYKYILGSACI